MKQNKKSTVFYCFSPPVMLATIVIESALLIYTLWRYKMSPLIRAIAATLVFLTTFQLAEYFVCGGLGQSAAFWSRVGFVAITALPPLGVHLAHIVAKQPTRKLVLAAYATGFGWALIFGTSEWAFKGHMCGGNYVIFQLRDYLGWYYSVFYYGWLLTTLWLCYSFAKAAKPKVRQALYSLAIGLLVFMVPTAIAITINPENIKGIPSIMCGFAVFFAVLLVIHTIPLITTKRDLR